MAARPASSSIGVRPQPVVLPPTAGAAEPAQLENEITDTAALEAAAVGPQAQFDAAPRSAAGTRLSGASATGRVTATALPPSPSNWRNTLDLSTATPNPLLKNGEWTKLMILPSAPNTVYFQNANKYPFHYDFAHAFLPEFKTMTRQQFDAVTLGTRNQAQQANLGALLVGPDNQFALQLVNNTPLDQARTLALLQSAKKAIKLPPNAKLFYFPTAEQRLTAKTFEPALAAAGFPLGTADQWQTGNKVYSTGWAIGRLVYVPTAEIDAKYKSGALKATDILLTDSVPAEVPHVAGIVSLEASTPNSHVALLAQSHNIPFGFARDEALANSIKALAGQEIVLRAAEGDSRLGAQALGSLPAEFRKQLLELREPAPLAITAKERTGKYGIGMDELGLHELAHVGSKAANYAILKKALPAESVNKAAALTFDAWDDFMKVKVASTARPGRQVTLREEIDHRLARFQTYPPTDIAAAETALASVRDLITDTELPQSVKDGIVETIKGPAGKPRFQVGEELRFRSSTNVEDTDTFTGAGLYDSYSGTLARDLGVPANPGAGNRGAFAAVRRTMASFYNDNAFLERRRLKVDETKVGMAILVHGSSPDEGELANGVVTVSVDEFGQQTMKVVTQAGADSVTNPDLNAPKPEVMNINRSPQGDVDFWREQASESPKVRLGESVMEEPKDYQRFAKLFGDATTAFIDIRGKTPPIKVDMEFKKELPGPGETGNQFVVKQIRVVPSPAGRGPAALVPATTELRTVQGEGADIFAAHAMKSRWKVTNQAQWLSGPNGQLTKSPITNVEVDYLEGGKVKHYAGPLSGFQGHTFSAKSADDLVTLDDTWASEVGDNTLEMQTGASTSVSEGPLTELANASMTWGVKLKKPVNVVRSEMDANGVYHDVKRDERELVSRLATNIVTEKLVDRWNFEAPGKGLRGAAVKIAPRYRYAFQAMDQMIKTEMLGEWDKTTITGLTTTPLVLKSEFSQTMVPAHHNVSEAFLFEPGLDPSVSAASLAELKRQNIVKVMVDQAQKFWVCGTNGKWRAL